MLFLRTTYPRRKIKCKKNQGRPLKDGEIKSACQTACPNKCHHFRRSKNNKEGVVAKTFDHSGRNYFA